MEEKKAGRPTIYNEELAQKILQRLKQGESARSIARDPDMPHQSTIFDWAIFHPIFSVQYNEAKDVGLEVRAEEIEEIANTMPDIQRAKLVTDVMRWNMSKLKPKRFGDRLDIDQKHSGKIETGVSEKDKAEMLALLNDQKSTWTSNWRHQTRADVSVWTFVFVVCAILFSNIF